MSNTQDLAREWVKVTDDVAGQVKNRDRFDRLTSNSGMAFLPIALLFAIAYFTRHQSPIMGWIAGLAAIALVANLICFLRASSEWMEARHRLDALATFFSEELVIGTETIAGQLFLVCEGEEAPVYTLLPASARKADDPTLQQLASFALHRPLTHTG